MTLLKLAWSFLLWLLSFVTGRKEQPGVAQGRAEQKAADQQPAIDGASRIAKAGAQPFDRDSTQKRMDDGTF